MDTEEICSRSDSYTKIEFKELPKINIDEFDPQVMSKVFLEFGTFELIGPSIQKLLHIALPALEETKKLLSLPEEVLKKVPHQGRYHGFQDLREEFLKKDEQDSKAFTNNQIAFHLRPYYELLDIEGADIQVYYNYYAQVVLILQRLYKKIGKHFMDKKRMSNVDQDKSSMLTVRKYYKCKENETNISTYPHSDYGLLTLIISDQSGLEVLNGSNWIAPPHDNPQPRFYVNVGDWLLFQLNNKAFRPGVHRVVSNPITERFSVLLFLNPSNNDSIEILNDIVTFQQYAHKRSIYRKNL